MNKKWSNQRSKPALNNQNHKQTKYNYNENKWPTEWAAISQKVTTQQPQTELKLY